MKNMETDLSSAKIYTEFSGLQKLKLAAKNSSPEALEEVANQFEAFFMKMMLKQMRDANLGDGIFDSEQSRLYQDMMDQQMALNLSEKRIFGIAENIVRQLEHTVGNKAGRPEKLNSLPERIRFQNTMSQSSASLNTKDRDFQTPEEFIRKMRPYAEKAAKELGVSSSILLAQSALETGWGNKVIQQANGESSHNLFGIKADKRWDGSYVNVSSLEYVDGEARREYSNFKVYDSYQQSFEDYVDFIKGNDRYKTALNNSADGEMYIKALQQAGYATDPQYANKIIDIAQREAI